MGKPFFDESFRQLGIQLGSLLVLPFLALEARQEHFDQPIDHVERLLLLPQLARHGIVSRFPHDLHERRRVTYARGRSRFELSSGVAIVSVALMTEEKSAFPIEEIDTLPRDSPECFDHARPLLAFFGYVERVPCSVSVERLHARRFVFLKPFVNSESANDARRYRHAKAP